MSFPGIFPLIPRECDKAHAKGAKKTATGLQPAAV
jgi:hypothetical protein